MLNLEQQIFRQIEKSSSILIAFPSVGLSGPAGGDTLASALAFYLFLKALGKEVSIAGLSSGADGSALSFLPSYHDIRRELKNLRRFIVSIEIGQSKIHNIRYTVDNGKLNFIISPADGWFRPEDVTARAGEFQYDLIISIGAQELGIFGRAYDENVEFFYNTPVINIDHHSANEEYGQINFLDLNAIATCEILFYLFKNYRPDLLSEDITTCLLAGIIQQTKNFKTANLTPRTLLTTSELIDRGARREEIVDHLYRSRDLESLKLWGRILNNLKSESGGALLWSSLRAEDFRDTGASPDRLTDLVDELIANVPNAKLIAIIYEESRQETRIFLYSLRGLNAMGALKEYDASGTSKSAEATINKPLDEATNYLISDLKSLLEKLAL